MTNLFRNPSFEEGIDKWGFTYAPETTPNPHDPADHARFAQPEVHVLDLTDLPEHEHELFILDGTHTLKIAKASQSWYAALFQGLNLEPGNHRVTINLFGDLVKDYRGPDKVWADDPAGRDGLFRFIIDGQRTDWQSIIPGRWNTFNHIFSTKGTATIGADIMCPFPLKNNGIFADAWELVFISKPPPPIPTEDDAVLAFRKAWRELFPDP